MSREIENIAAQLRDLSERLAAEETTSLTAPRARKARRTIAAAYEKIRIVLDDLDPIKHPGYVFKPSNPEVAGRIIGVALIAQPRKPMEAIARFYGSGVYALYYRGNFHAYKRISGMEHPIYIGKADPAKPNSETALEQGDRLARRLKEHSKNLVKVSTTLNLNDFEYRALVVQTGYQSAAEEYLINLFKPIWNKEIEICYGFGKHGDSPDTRANLRSPWDTLHPGREWAHRDPNMKDARLQSTLIQAIAAHFAKYPPLRSVDEILRRFLDEMREIS
ncbi:Eco29kI family restriction endonuclease [bacterium]|nr:Eco29kI family restriction endonuclease [bacterium]